MTDILERLRNRRELINCGNGDVRDVPDELCSEAAAEIAALREALAHADIKLEP